MTSPLRRAGILTLLLFAMGSAPAFPGPGDVKAQSLLGTGGLGVPVEAVGAQGRGMGSVGAGLFGWHLSPHDPGAAHGLRIPSVVASMQPTTVTVDANGEPVEGGGTRFPLLGITFPFDRGVLTVTFAGAFDQDWEARHEHLVDLGPEAVDVEDVFRSQGGLSTLRVGWSRTVAEDFGVGVGVGTYLGSIERSFTRNFDTEQVGEDVEPFRAQGRWDARGPTAAVGLTWQPSSSFRVGGSAVWSGDLELRPTDASVEAGVEERGKYTLPTEFRVGGSASLTPVIALNLGVSYADWSEIGNELRDGGSRGPAWSYGGGLEWRGVQLLGRPLPIRAGHRRTELPFLYQGEPADEAVTTGGFSLALAEAEEVPLARVDVAVERGSREAGDFSERLWRTTVTLRLAGG